MCVCVSVLMLALECAATVCLRCYLDLKREKKRKKIFRLVPKRPN